MPLRPEQKLVESIMYLVSKFCKAGEVVLNTYAGTLVTAKACLRLPETCQFLGREEGYACFQNSLPALVMVKVK